MNGIANFLPGLNITWVVKGSKNLGYYADQSLVLIDKDVLLPHRGLVHRSFWFTVHIGRRSNLFFFSTLHNVLC